jgi:prepilin-type N-terminal cleavage/methylation domain-containing protein
MHRGIAGPTAAGARAFTLVESLLAIAIMAILLGAMSGVIVTVSRATERGDDRNARASAAASVLSEIADDLASSNFIPSSAAPDLVIQVPDRTGDGVEETISYSWSGKPGDPLFRSANSGAAVKVLDDVRSLVMSPAKRNQPSYLITGAKSLLDATTAPAGSTASQWVVGSSGAYGQYLRPDLPDRTVDWAPTSIRIRAQRSGLADGAVLVQVFIAGPGGLPTTQVIARAGIQETSLSTSASWVTIPLASSVNLSPTTGVVVTFTSVASLSLLTASAGPVLPIGAGGGLGGIVGSITGTLGLSATDAMSISAASDPTGGSPLRMIKSSDGATWDPTYARANMLCELNGTYRTVSY